MSVKELCVISIMACIEAVIFSSFSNILYLEGITLTILLFAVAFPRRTAFMAAVVFGLVNMIAQGVTLWTMMYLMMYPSYTLLICALKPFFKENVLIWSIFCGILSFLTGQILQIPWMLFSKRLTMLYVLAGLKTSLIQGCVSAVFCFLVFRTLRDVLKRIERRFNL